MDSGKDPGVKDSGMGFWRRFLHEGPSVEDSGVDSGEDSSVEDS